MPSPPSISADNLAFAWDRHETAETLMRKLADPSDPDWIGTAAWLMREAKVEEVWQFLTLRQIEAQFTKLQPLLGRRKDVWEYLLKVARELGRL